MNEFLKSARAQEHLLGLLQIPGLSGDEVAVANGIERCLHAAGCKKTWIRRMPVRPPLPKHFQMGNLVIQLPGTFAAPRRMFLAHMDTVPLCREAQPVIKQGRVVARGKTTALGADNRAGVAALVTVAETILRNKLPHPPLTFLFTVGEEVGLYGAKSVRSADVGRPAYAFNFDSGRPEEIITGAIGAERWRAELHGISSHAGMHPERGASSILMASRALTEVADRGWFGKVQKGKMSGTSNAGVIHGGEATNQVTHHVVVRGESRSHNPRFIRQITAAYRTAFERAARRTRNAAGEHGRVAFTAENDYLPFSLPERAPVVQFTQRIATELGLKTKCVAINGGLDANPLNANGIPTVTLGVGAHCPHAYDEYVDLAEFQRGCRLTLALATAR
ncbi:MAG: M20/M25/M40 family metallo-hydrolase [Verrucomicrobia bacterium]|nr:MAG: M20/M25/M40 family metallo-hydrolase [Verrucomicrobiota bacterium]